MKVEFYVAAAWVSLCLFGCGGGGGYSPGGRSTTTTGGASFAPITDLGPVFSQHQINDSGLIVGEVAVGNTASFADSMTAASPPTALPGPGESGAEHAQSTEAFTVNDSGVVGGFAQNKGQIAGSAVIWRNGSMQVLPSPFIQQEGYIATSINDHNQIVGTEAPFGAGVNLNGIQGYYWASPTTEAVELPKSFIPEYINDSGIAVGEVYSGPDENNAEFCEINLNSTTTQLTDLKFGNTFQGLFGDNAGIVIDNAGTIVVSNGANYDMIQISPNGTKTQLGVGDVPQAMNQKGDVVGKNTKNHAFIYTPSKGVVDMNQFVNPSTGLTLQVAYSINNSGQVLAEAQTKGGASECVLVQLPQGDF